MNIKDISFANADSCEFELLKDKTRGRMVIELNMTTTSGNKRLRYAIPIYSIWVDSDTNNAIRAFCFLQKSTRNEILFKILNKFKGITIYGHKSENTLSNHGDIIRYGCKPGLTTEIEDSDYIVHEVFESKTKMLHSIFDTIKTCKQIGGFDSCNLEKIPDKFFELFGFISVKDYFGRMPPMWKARPSLILNPDASGSSYHSYQYSRELLKKRGELFLEVIKAILSGSSVIDAVKKRRSMQ
jgi:hypothetical protein